MSASGLEGLGSGARLALQAGHLEQDPAPSRRGVSFRVYGLGSGARLVLDHAAALQALQAGHLEQGPAPSRRARQLDQAGGCLQATGCRVWRAASAPSTVHQHTTREPRAP